MVDEKSEKTTAMIALMWGWPLARELTDLRNEEGSKVFTEEELEIMSGFGLAGGQIHDALRETNRPQLDEWGIQGPGRQDKVRRDWTGEEPEKSEGDSCASYQEGYTDWAIHRHRQERAATMIKIIGKLWRRGTVRWAARYRHSMRFP
jgi:hypothetical protein